MRAVTTAQKQIEASISGDSWARQWRTNQQKDAYVTLISALNRYGAAFNAATDAFLFEDRRPGRERATATMNTAADEFLRAETVAELFCGEHVAEALKRVHQEITDVSARYNWALERQEGDIDDSVYLQPADLLTTLVDAARLDLGMPAIQRQSSQPMSFTPRQTIF